MVYFLFNFFDMGFMKVTHPKTRPHALKETILFEDISSKKQMNLKNIQNNE